MSLSSIDRSPHGRRSTAPMAAIAGPGLRRSCRSASSPALG